MIRTNQTHGNYEGMKAGVGKDFNGTEFFDGF
jgi:hypothetical protein